MTAGPQAIEEVMVLDAGGIDSGQGADGGGILQERREAFSHAHPIPKAAYDQHPSIVVMLDSGCRPRQLKGLLSRLMYSSLANPARYGSFHPDPRPHRMPHA